MDEASLSGMFLGVLDLVVLDTGQARAQNPAGTLRGVVEGVRDACLSRIRLFAT